MCGERLPPARVAPWQQSCGGAPFLRTVCVVVASLVPLSTHQLRACRHSGLTLWPYPIQTKSKMTGEKVEIPPAVRKDMADLFAQIDEDNGGTVRARAVGSRREDCRANPNRNGYSLRYAAIREVERQ
jgi:hypothetical protein